MSNDSVVCGRNSDAYVEPPSTANITGHGRASDILVKHWPGRELISALKSQGMVSKPQATSSSWCVDGNPIYCCERARSVSETPHKAITRSAVVRPSRTLYVIERGGCVLTEYSTVVGEGRRTRRVALALKPSIAPKQDDDW